MSGCPADLCIVCGRKKGPLFELNGVATPAHFDVPVLSVSIPSYKETMSGAGASYNLKVSDKEGGTWLLTKRYTDFEMLHQQLKGITWSDALESVPPFPRKEMFPSVKKRAQLFATYMTSVCDRIRELDRRVQALVIRFLQATYTSQAPVLMASVPGASVGDESSTTAPDQATGVDGVQPGAPRARLSPGVTAPLRPEAAATVVADASVAAGASGAVGSNGSGEENPAGAGEAVPRVAEVPLSPTVEAVATAFVTTPPPPPAATDASPHVANTPIAKMREAKMMLNEGLIDENVIHEMNSLYGSGYCEV